MDNSITARTALSDMPAVNGMHSLTEIPLCGKINLRGDPADPSFIQGIENTLGVPLSLAANTTNEADDRQIFWLGPDEWLLHLPMQQLEQTMIALEQALANFHCAVCDVSDYFSVLELGGPQIQEIIASASPFDTRQAQFGFGQCAQTRFGHASILLWPRKEGSGFGLQVRWSYAQYVYDYLSQSIRNIESFSQLDQSV